MLSLLNHKVENELKNCMNGTMVEYYANEKMKKSWDKIQIEVYRVKTTKY